MSENKSKIAFELLYPDLDYTENNSPTFENGKGLFVSIRAIFYASWLWEFVDFVWQDKKYCGSVSVKTSPVPQIGLPFKLLVEDELLRDALYEFAKGRIRAK